MRKFLITFTLVLALITNGSMMVLGQQLSGQLITSANFKIKVNGAEAATGDSVFNASQIDVPNNVNAIINIGSWGKVELLPGTKGDLFFQNNDITLMLKEGCAILTTNKGITGKIVNGDNNLLKTNGQAVEGDVADNNLRKVPYSAAQSDGKLKRILPVCGVTAAYVAYPAGAPAAGGAGGGTGGAVGITGARLSGTALTLLISGISGGIITAIVTTGGGDNPSPSGL